MPRAFKDRPTDGSSRDAIAKRLALTRTVLGLSQKDFAGAADIAANTYSQYESGVSVPALDKLISICDTHNLTTDWILRGDPSGLPERLKLAIKLTRQARDELSPKV